MKEIPSMMEKPNKIRAAALGGLAIAIISGVPGLNVVNCCCCAGIMLGGVLAVHFHRKEFTDQMPPMESSDALILGIIAGIIGALGASLIGGIVMTLFGAVEERLVMDFFERFFSKLEDRGSIPPGTMDQMRDEFVRSMQEAQTVGGMLKNLFFALIIYPIFSMLGGLIGFGLFFKKKNPPAASTH
jgi:hypothetical protein